MTMRAQLFCFFILAVCYVLSDGANVQWRKLNRSPVCFGTRNNQFGSFIYRGKNIRAWAFMLVYRSGYVSCAANGRNRLIRSHWGCHPHHQSISVYLTDCRNKVIGPRHVSRGNRNGWYSLLGHTSSSAALIFQLGSRTRYQYPVSATNELRLWYGEDLRGYTEGDNGGRTCADVYAKISV